MTDRCRVSKYYPSSFWVDGNVYFIAKLDGGKPVKVLHNHFAVRGWCSYAINLFEIIRLFKTYIPESEDWYIAYEAGFDFDEDLRNRDIRKYTKGMVYEILERLATHGFFTKFNLNDLIKHSYRGEKFSYFRPHQTIHVDNFREVYKP